MRIYVLTTIQTFVAGEKKLDTKALKIFPELFQDVGQVLLVMTMALRNDATLKMSIMLH